MKIYAQSCGVSKEYCWVDRSQSRILELPSNLQFAIQTVDSDYFSVFLSRNDNELLLLVTALKSENRTDNRNRRICNSVAWICDESEEAILRDIVIQALEGELEQKVDKAIVSKKNDRGFTVDFQVLELKQLVPNSVKKGKQPNLESKIGNLSELKQDFIEEISQVSIPQNKNNGVLILVSSSLSQSAFQETQVWRGLSDVIDGDNWLEILSSKFQRSLKEGGDSQFRQKSVSQSNSPSKSSILPKPKTSTTSNSENNRDIREKSREINRLFKRNFFHVIVIFVLLVSLAGNAFFFYKWQDAKQDREQNSNLKQENQKLQQEKSKIEQEIEKSRKSLDELNQNIFNKDKKLQEANQLLDAVKKVFDETQNTLDPLITHIHQFLQQEKN